jgi:hypothetical protein
LSTVSRVPLRSVSDGPTSAVVADCEGPPSPTARALRDHDAVIRRIARIAPAVLPARFGSSVDSDRALMAILTASSRELQTALRLVDRQEQMTLRLFGPHQADAPREIRATEEEAEAFAGTRYLVACLRARSAPELGPLRPLLAPFVTAERIARHDRGPLILTAYHLIPRGAVAAYRRVLRRHAAGLGYRAISSGPWPPYAFVPELRA